MSEQSIRLALALIATGLLASGCEVGRMKVDSGLANTDALPVQGYGPHKWDQSIAFGTWETSAVRENWRMTRRLWIEDGERREVASYDSMRRPFGFNIDTYYGMTHVQCFIRGKAAAVHGWQADIGMLKKIPPLKCDYAGPVDGHLELLQKMTVGTAEEGEMQFASDRWHVSSVSRLENARFDTGQIVGYEIRDRDQVVGAIETINHGRVWINPALNTEDEARVAVLAATLLHYQLVYDPIEPRDDHDHLDE